MTVAAIRTEEYGRTHLNTWSNMSEASGSEVGVKVTIPGAADRSVQISGDLGGGTLVIQGSNIKEPDESAGSADFETLNDAFGSPLRSITTEMRSINENVLFIRPLLEGGTSADVTVRILNRSTVK